jgi:hypothetical protein
LKYLEISSVLDKASIMTCPKRRNFEDCHWLAAKIRPVVSMRLRDPREDHVFKPFDQVGCSVREDEGSDRQYASEVRFGESTAMWKQQLKAKAARLAADDAARAETVRRKRSAVRVRLIHNEVDLMRADAADRARSVDFKASFLAVSAGVIIAAAASSDWHQPLLLALLPMTFSALGLGFAAIALRPGTRPDVTPQILFDRWADSERQAATVEADILKSKVAAFAEREKMIRSRARSTTIGFSFLLAAVLSLVVVFALESV